MRQAITPGVGSESGNRDEHADAERKHHQCAHNRADRNDAIERACRESPLAAGLFEQSSEDRSQQRDPDSKRDQHRRQTETERDDRDHPERCLPDSGRKQQDRQRIRTGRDAAGDAKHRELPERNPATSVAFNVDLLDFRCVETSVFLIAKRSVVMLMDVRVIVIVMMVVVNMMLMRMRELDRRRLRRPQPAT